MASACETTLKWCPCRGPPLPHALRGLYSRHLGPVSLRLKMSQLWDIASRQILTPRKMHILRCMGLKFCVKFQRCLLKFHTKFWTHTPQNMHFIVFNFCVWVTISLNCDVISLSETGPCATDFVLKMGDDSIKNIFIETFATNTKTNRQNIQNHIFILWQIEE